MYRLSLGAVALFAVVLLGGCGGSSGTSSSTVRADLTPSSSGATERGAGSQTAPDEQQQEDAAHGEAAQSGVETGEHVSGGDESGGYNGQDLCDLDGITTVVRGLYRVKPSTEVTCRPAQSHPGLTAEWNWWVSQPSEEYRAPETQAEVKLQRQLEAQTGENAISERIMIQLGPTRSNGKNVWIAQRSTAQNPSNGEELIEINGREAIWWVANDMLLTLIRPSQLLWIFVFPSYNPAEGKLAATSIAELIEQEAF